VSLFTNSGTSSNGDSQDFYFLAQNRIPECTVHGDFVGPVRDCYAAGSSFPGDHSLLIYMTAPNFLPQLPATKQANPAELEIDPDSFSSIIERPQHPVATLVNLDEGVSAQDASVAVSDEDDSDGSASPSQRHGDMLGDTEDETSSEVRSTAVVMLWPRKIQLFIRNSWWKQETESDSGDEDPHEEQETEEQRATRERVRCRLHYHW